MCFCQAHRDATCQPGGAGGRCLPGSAVWVDRQTVEERRACRGTSWGWTPAVLQVAHRLYTAAPPPEPPSADAAAADDADHGMGPLAWEDEKLLPGPLK
jgi:hypothetical protein